MRPTAANELGRIRAELKSNWIAMVSCASLSSRSARGARFIRLVRDGSFRLCTAICRKRAALRSGPACSTPWRLLMRSVEPSATCVVAADAFIGAS